MAAQRVRPPPPTGPRRGTRPLPPSLRPRAPTPSTRPAARKTWRHWSIASMGPLAARHGSPRAGTSAGSRCAAPRGRSKAGKPRPTGRTISSSSRSRGSSGRRAVPQARARPCGGRMAIGRASRRPWSAAASRPAGPGTPGPSAPGPRTPGAVFLSRRRSPLKRGKRHAPGMPVQRGGNAPHVVREAKALWRKACEPWACDGPVIGGSREAPLARTWPSPPRSL